MYSIFTTNGHILVTSGHPQVSVDKLAPIVSAFCAEFMNQGNQNQPNSAVLRLHDITLNIIIQEPLVVSLIQDTRSDTSIVHHSGVILREILYSFLLLCKDDLIKVIKDYDCEMTQIMKQDTILTQKQVDNNADDALCHTLPSFVPFQQACDSSIRYNNHTILNENCLCHYILQLPSSECSICERDVISEWRRSNIDNEIEYYIGYHCQFLWTYILKQCQNLRELSGINCIMIMINKNDNDDDDNDINILLQKITNKNNKNNNNNDNDYILISYYKSTSSSSSTTPITHTHNLEMIHKIMTCEVMKLEMELRNLIINKLYCNDIKQYTDNNQQNNNSRTSASPFYWYSKEQETKHNNANDNNTNNSISNTPSTSIIKTTSNNKSVNISQIKGIRKVKVRASSAKTKRQQVVLIDTISNKNHTSSYHSKNTSNNQNLNLTSITPVLESNRSNQDIPLNTFLLVSPKKNQLQLLERKHNHNNHHNQNHEFNFEIDDDNHSFMKRVILGK